MKSFMVRPMFALMFFLSCAVNAQAQDDSLSGLTDMDLSIDFIDSSLLLADSSTATSSGYTVPNIPDSAFTKPWVTANNVHMYLGLASIGFAAVTGLTADSVSKDNGSADLLSNLHVVSAKAAWQLGALAVGTGLYTHWDDFHLSDGILDRDNLHALLGIVGTLGYFLAVNSAVGDYNDNSGAVTTDHASYGILGGAAMLTAIAFTW